MHRAVGVETALARVNPVEACCHGFVASFTTNLLREFGIHGQDHNMQIKN